MANPIYKWTLYDPTNLLNRNDPDVMLGYALNPQGQVIELAGYNLSGWIKLVPGGKVYINKFVATSCFYNGQKQRVSSIGGGSAGWYQIPKVARYIRVSVPIDAWTTYSISQARLCKPNYKEDLTKDWELESGQRFYRAKLGGKISFIRDDYDYLAAQPFETQFTLLIDKSDDLGVTWSQDLQCKFMKTDCTWNDDDKKVTVQPETLDEYNDVIAGLEKEYNLIELAPVIQPLQFKKRPLIQIYIPGDTVISCFLGGMYWEQDCNEVTDRNALVNTYYFALCNLLKEVNVTGSTNPNVNALYSGRMSIGANNTFTGNLYPNVSNGYYIRASQVYERPFWGKITYEFVRSSDSVVVYRYSYISPGNLPEDNLDFDAPAVAGSGATGSAHCEMATYSIYARYLLDVDKIGNLNTYPLPSEDIVDNNRNYHRVIGYAIDIAYISNQSQAEPTQWGIRDDGTYFLPPYSIYGDVFYPIARSTWRYASVWFAFYLLDWIIEQQARKMYVLRDANPLASVISVILKQFAPGITHEATAEYSQFLYGTTNPISGNNQFTLMLSQKSNVLNGDYDRPAQKAPITLQQITNMLRDCFRCYWYIENGKFKIEHVQFFRNGGSYSGQIVAVDLTQATNIRNGLKWSFNTANWDFDKIDMPERFQFAWMDDVTKGFAGLPIQVISKYVTAGKIESVNVSNFNPDVDFMILNSGAISEDGFALFAASWSTIVSRSIYTGEPDQLTPGYYIGYNSGQLIPNAACSASEFMQVAGGQKYKFKNTQQFAWYDSTQTYLSGVANSSDDVEYYAPPNAAFLRVTIFNHKLSGYDVLGFSLPFITMQIDGTEYQLQNGYLSWIYLQPTYYPYDLPARHVQINGSETSAYGIERKKKQTVNFPSVDDLDPMQLIKTSIGTGQIEKISVNLSSRMNKITVKHDTE